MRILIAFLLLLSAAGTQAQRVQTDTLLEYIQRQQYGEALAAVQNGAAVAEQDLPALLEYNSRTQLLREKPAGYHTTLELLDSLLARLRYYNGTDGVCTPLGYAIANGDSSMVRILLAKGVHTGADNIVHIGYDLTAFQYAAFRYPARQYPAEGLAVLRLLQASGADVSAATLVPFQTHVSHSKNIDLPAGANALDIAIASGAPAEVVSYLRALGLKEMAGK